MIHHTPLHDPLAELRLEQQFKARIRKVSLGALVAGVAAGAPAVVGTSVGVGGAAVLSTLSDLVASNHAQAQEVRQGRTERFSILAMTNATGGDFYRGTDSGIVTETFTNGTPIVIDAADLTGSSVLYLMGATAGTGVLVLTTVSGIGSVGDRWGTLRFGGAEWFGTAGVGLTQTTGDLSTITATISATTPVREIELTTAKTTTASFTAGTGLTVSAATGIGSVYAGTIELFKGQTVTLNAQAVGSTLNVFGDWSVVDVLNTGGTPVSSGAAVINVNPVAADEGAVSLYASSISGAPDLNFGAAAVKGSLAILQDPSETGRAKYEFGDIKIGGGGLTGNLSLSFVDGDVTANTVTLRSSSNTAAASKTQLSISGGVANIDTLSLTGVGANAASHVNLRVAGNSQFGLESGLFKTDLQQAFSQIQTGVARELDVGVAKGQTSERKVTISGGDFTFTEVTVREDTRLVISKGVNIPFLRGLDEIMGNDANSMAQTGVNPLAGVEFAFVSNSGRSEIEFGGGGIIDLGNRDVNLILGYGAGGTFLTDTAATTPAATGTGSGDRLTPFATGVTLRAANFSGYQLLGTLSTGIATGTDQQPNLDVNGSGVIDFSHRSLASKTLIPTGTTFNYGGAGTIDYAGRLTSSGGGTVIVGSGISEVGALGSGGQNGFSNLVFAPAGNASTFAFTVGGDYSVGEIVYANSSTGKLALIVGGTGAVITGNIAAPLASTDSTVEVTGGTLNADIGLTGGVIDTVTFTGDTTVNGAIFANSLAGAVNLTFDGARMPTVDTRIALTKVAAVTGPPMMPAMSGSVTTHGSVTFQSDSFAAPGGVTVDASKNPAGSVSGQSLAIIMKASNTTTGTINTGDISFTPRVLSIEERKAGVRFVTDVDLVLSAADGAGTIRTGAIGTTGARFNSIDISAKEYAEIKGSLFAKEINVKSGVLEVTTEMVGADISVAGDLVTGPGASINFLAEGNDVNIKSSVGASEMAGDLGVGGDSEIVFEEIVNARNLVVLGNSEAGVDLTGRSPAVTFQRVTALEEIDFSKNAGGVTVRGAVKSSGETLASIGFVRVQGDSDAELLLDAEEIDGISRSETLALLGGIGAVSTAETLFEDVETLINDPNAGSDHSIAKLELKSGGQRHELHVRSEAPGQQLSARAIDVTGGAALLGGYSLYPEASVTIADNAGLVFENVAINDDKSTVDLPAVDGIGTGSYFGFIGDKNSFVGSLDVNTGIARQGRLTFGGTADNKIATSSLTSGHELVAEKGSTITISSKAKLALASGSKLELQEGSVLELESRPFIDSGISLFDMDALISGDGEIVVKKGSIVRVKLDTIPRVEELSANPRDVTDEERANGAGAIITKTPISIAGLANRDFVDTVSLEGLDGAFTGTLVFNEGDLRTDLVIEWRGLESHLKGTNVEGAAKTLDDIYLFSDDERDEVVSNSASDAGQQQVYRAYRDLVQEVYVDPPKLQNLMPVNARSETTTQALSVAERSIELTSVRLASVRQDKVSPSGVATGDPRDGGIGFWAQTFFGGGSSKASGDVPGASSTYAGFAFGGDTSLQSNVLVGGAMTYASGTVKGKGSATGDKSKNSTVLIAGYGTVDMGQYFIDGALSFGRTTFSLTDHIGLLNVGDLSNSTTGTQVGAKAIVGYKLPTSGAFQVTPKVSLSFQSLSTTPYDQKIGQIERTVEASKDSYFSVGFGATISQELRRGATILRPTGSFMLLLDFGRKATEGNFKYTNLDISNSNTIKGSPPTNSGFQIDLGVDALNAGGGWDVGGYYTGEFRSGRTNHTLRFNARYAF